MALDLTLTVTADATKAKAELREVEQGIQRVDAAAQKSSTNQATWWQKEEKAIEKVTGVVTAHRNEMSKVEQAFAKADAAAAVAERSAAKLGTTTSQTTAALSGMRAGTTDVATGLLEMAGAGGLSVGMLATLGAGIGAVAAGLLGFISIIASSTQHYIEHSKAAAGLREEIDRVSDTWGAFQMLVGGAVMEGEQAPLISFLRLAQSWALELGLKLAGDILLVKELANAVPGVGLLRGMAANADPGKLPNPADVLGGAHPLGSTFGWVAGGAGALQFPSGSTAEAIFARDEAARKRAQQEADRAREKRRRELEAIQRAFESGPGYRLGLSGQIAGQVGAPTAPFDPSGMLSYRLGLSGSLPEAVSVETMLKGVLQGPGLGSRIFGSMGTSLGRVLENILVNQGSGGSATGGAIGGSIFGSLMQGGSGKAIGGALSGLFGSKIGGAIGNFIPFGGQILGSLVGKLFGSMFGPTQYETRERDANKSIADLWKSMNGQFGGTADRALSMFGFDAGALHGKDFKGAMGLDPLKGVFDELQKRQGEFNSKLGDTLGKIHELGGEIPDALRPYIDSLKDAKVLTQDNVDLLERLANPKIDFDKLGQIGRKYGISETSLGAGYNQNEWQKMIDDMDTLARGGANMDGVLEGMQDEIGELVRDSMALGTTIPDNMKPWIQKLIESGKLLGLNGEKIEDINQLSFGDTMQTSLDKLNDTLKELIDTLRYKLPAAAREGSEGVRREFDNLPVPGGRGKDPYHDTEGLPPPVSASSRSGGGTAIVQLDGRTIMHAVIPHMPGIVKTYVGRR